MCMLARAPLTLHLRLAAGSIAHCAMSRNSIPHSQVVAVRGLNAGAGRMAVTQLYTHAARPRLVLPPRPAAAASEGPLSIVVAAGPFTCAGDLLYEPLQVRDAIFSREDGREGATMQIRLMLQGQHHNAWLAASSSCIGRCRCTTCSPKAWHVSSRGRGERGTGATQSGDCSKGNI